MTELFDSLADIPRSYTAVAEWGACLVYILLVARRRGWVRTVIIALIGIVGLIAVQVWAGMLPLALWIPGMLAAASVMFLLLRTALRVSSLTAGYLVARAFVLAELTASLHWQLDRFYLGDAGPVVQVCVMLASYGAILSVAWLLERRHFRRGEVFDVGWRELVSAVAIAAVTFGISNLSFANSDTAFSGRLGPEILYIRTLVDLCGFIALYAQLEMRRELETRKDAEAMAQLLRSQHEQYETSRRAMDEISRIHHDMAHHLEALRAESEPEVRARMLDDLEETVRDSGVQVQSGNRVIDTVLTAKRMRAREDHVEVSYVVDGTLLDFLGPLDVTAILGNAMDNALEATRALAEQGDRLVRVALFAQDDFVMLRVENTYDGVLRRANGRIVSRKREPGHGYGLRNIEAAVEKYGGSISITADDGWFSLRMLFPRQ